MAQPPLPQFSTSGANVVAPSGGLKASGWIAGTRPPSQIFNWIHKLTYDWFVYLAGIIPDGAVPLKSDTDAEAALTAGTFANAEQGLNPAVTDTFRLADSMHMYRVRTALANGPSANAVAFVAGRQMSSFASNGAGRIVGVAASGSGAGGVIGYSDDNGVTWTQAFAGSSFTDPFNCVIYAAGKFVLCGGASGGTSSATIQTSTDGITWTQRLSAASNAVWNVAYNGTVFCAQLWDGTTYAVYTSPDAVTWTSAGVTTAFNTAPQGCVGGGGLFVKGQNVVSNNIYTSPDGVTWTSRAMGSSDSFLASRIAYHVNWGWCIAGADGSNVNKYLQHSSNGTTGWARVRKDTNDAGLVTGLLGTPHAVFVLCEHASKPCWSAHLGAYSDSGGDFNMCQNTKFWYVVNVGSNTWVALSGASTSNNIARVAWID